MSTHTMSLNVGNFVTLKLSPTNYPMWHEQVLALAESQDLTDHLLQSAPSAAESSEKSSDKTAVDLASWTKSDRLFHGWIIGSLSEESLGLAIGQETAHDVWESLKSEYAQNSQERAFTLRQQLLYYRKDDTKTLADHLRGFKSICDNLAAIGSSFSDADKVYSLLTSLGPNFEHFTTTMLKPPRPSYAEVVSQLQSFDQRHSLFSTDAVLSSPLAFYSHQQKGILSSRPSHPFTSAGRGFTAQRQAPLNSSRAPNSRPNSSGP